MAGREVTKVVNRCNDAKEDNKLDLSSCLLAQIPDAIFFLLKNTPLETCDLSYNMIRRIPSKLGIKFPLLSDLNLSGNKLIILPDELKEITGLKTLDISHNRFLILPKVIYKLENLKELNAKKNMIKDIDVARLKKMSSLGDVNLEENPLTNVLHKQLKEIQIICILVSNAQEQNGETKPNTEESGGNAEQTNGDSQERENEKKDDSKENCGSS